MGSANSISEKVQKILEINPDSSVNDLIDCVQDATNIIEHIPSDYSINYEIKNHKNVDDWKHWSDDYSKNVFQMQVFFSHNVFLPPRHSIHLEFGPKDEIETIQILYEYYFDHLLVLRLPIDIALIPILKYAKSLQLFAITEYSIEKKKRSLKKIPLIGKWFANLYFSPWFGSSIGQVWESIEVNSTKIMHEFESFLESHMTLEDIKNKMDAYEKFFEGVPESHRGIYIQR